ncbi:1-hydroxy-2-methyl-2-(E)-butenyl 4-diphosphate synthase [Methylacidiphilum kamchatkense Kam1]|uniref:1-hydroxy-2-methyl-2-(E)-butenyl 4-diphosphate synthase n=1 Tax=Methylacidiphilum kamchatkense Kam1 TaxID=1202785 RepID=A0A516TK18_9BACT|nr:1-hydroxy-2-methyl-2-(E)-butenyl 4-diphosphate synthase [Methylacidiphilum kamchatkense Kam1]
MLRRENRLPSLILPNENGGATMFSYKRNFFEYTRRPVREVRVGSVGLGGHHPIVVQSMLTSDTMDTDSCLKEAMELVDCGCQIVRITAPTVKDAANLEFIRKGLDQLGCNVPIVADIHFKPEAAMEAAKWVEKIRINPGNFSDRKKFIIRSYTDQEYNEELRRIEQTFLPLLEFCSKRKIALRIGTNHGSLSDRIMNRYGTALMVWSKVLWNMQRFVENTAFMTLSFR